MCTHLRHVAERGFADSLNPISRHSYSRSVWQAVEDAVRDGVEAVVGQVNVFQIGHALEDVLFDQ